MTESILQTERECYITGRTGALHRHHLWGGGRRQLSEKHGLWVWLTPEWHNLSDYGVHFNHDLDRKLKQDGQRAFEQTHTRAEFMAIFYKNYLED